MKKQIKFFIKFLIIIACVTAGGYIGYHFVKPIYKYMLPPWIIIPLQHPPEKAASILGAYPDSSLLLPIGDTVYIQSTSGNIYHHTNFFSGWEAIDVDEYQSMDRSYYFENKNEPPRVPRNLFFIQKPIDIFDIIYERPLSIIWHTYVITPNGNLTIWIRENNINWMLFNYAFCSFIGACIGLLMGIKISKFN